MLLRALRLAFLFAGNQKELAMKQIRINAVFIGSVQEKWRLNVPMWGGVRYNDLYPSVDLSGGKLCQPNPFSP